MQLLEKNIFKDFFIAFRDFIKVNIDLQRRLI